MSQKKLLDVGGGYSYVTSIYLSNANDKAFTSGIYQGDIKYIYFSTNSNANMIDSGTCQWYQDNNFEYVANHEFGHFAGLIHVRINHSYCCSIENYRMAFVWPFNSSCSVFISRYTIRDMD